MKRRIISLFVAAILMFSCFGITASAQISEVVPQTGYIDNSDLLPEILPDSEVQLILGDNGTIMSPDWVKTLIIEEVCVSKASPDGKFSGMTYVLDHLAQMGVNGIWLDPIYDGKHYRNYGPATVNTYITGELDYEKGWQVVKNFVDEAHKRNIRVFFDVVTWGCNSIAPIYLEHPDWFKNYSEAYEGPLFNWENKEFYNWFLKELERIIMFTGADGFRADCGIDYCGPQLYKELRANLLAKGRKIAIIGEAATNRTDGVFDFEEHSVDIETANLWNTGKFFTDMYDIVDSVKNGTGIGTLELQQQKLSGQGTYYSALVSCHDSQNYIADGSLLKMGYSAILAPFIPMWFMGEEWCNTYNSTGWLYANVIDWYQIDDNRNYFETIKAYIRIRRLYPEIFEYTPENHRDSNICAVKTDHLLALTAYARYTDEKAVLVIPNKLEPNATFNVTVPYKEMGFDLEENYKIVNLLTGNTVGVGNVKELTGFTTNIPLDNLGVYLVEKASAKDLAAFNNQNDKNGKKTTDKTEDGVGIMLWVIGGVVLILIAAAAVFVIIYRKRKSK